MKIAVTDFDGTLSRQRMVADSDLEAIRQWRDAGGLFGIATGRALSMTVLETEKWGIPFDFLICANGAVVYNSDLQVLASRDMGAEVIGQLLRHPAAGESFHWQICCGDTVKVHVKSDLSWFPRIGVPYEDVAEAEALAVTDAEQVSLAYATDVECNRWVAELTDRFGDDIKLHQNAAFVDITAGGIDKAVGIGRLLELAGWNGADIFVIGDAENDLAMIRKYDGFTVPGARDVIKKAARAVFPSVGDMLTAVRTGKAGRME